MRPRTPVTWRSSPSTAPRLKSDAGWIPLLNGEIRSASPHDVEPDVASSDATNIRMRITQDGGPHWVLNGSVRASLSTDNLLTSVTEMVEAAVPATRAASYTSSWARLTRTTTTPIGSSRSCWCRQTRQVGITVTVCSAFRLRRCPARPRPHFVPQCACRATTSVLGPGKGFEIIQGRLGPGGFTTPCGPLAR